MNGKAYGAAVLILGSLFTGCASGPAPAAPEAAQASVQESEPACVLPIGNGLLPESESLLPGAPRHYRRGVHEGVDFYHKASGARITCVEPVVNVRAGWIERVDRDWQVVDAEEYERLTDLLKRGVDPGNDEARIDRLRGRQVWVQTEDGTVFRYCHLTSIAPYIEPGSSIAAGIVLGTVGNTGTEASAQGPGGNCHLHFEVRLPSGKYLGEGMSPSRARRLYADLFKVN